MNLLNWQLQERVSLRFQNKASNEKESLFVTQHLFILKYVPLPWLLGSIVVILLDPKKQVTLCATSFLSDVVQFLHLQYEDSYDLFQSSSHFGAVANHFN